MYILKAEGKRGTAPVTGKGVYVCTRTFKKLMSNLNSIFMKIGSVSSVDVM